MGYTTDFVGYVLIDPPLNIEECEYLTAFTQTRRWFRQAGPYVVLDNPAVEEPCESVERYNTPWPGEPSLWCPWRPSLDGTCLAFDGIEKAYRPVEWMRYLISHFLRPDAEASMTMLPEFEQFTFDHIVDGVIVGCRRDTGRMFAIEVASNVVEERVLMRGAPEEDWGPLPYQTAIDTVLPARRRLS